MASSSLLTDVQKQLNKNKKEIDMLKNKLETVESDHENLLGDNSNLNIIIKDRSNPNMSVKVKINGISKFLKKYVEVGVNTGPYYLISSNRVVGVKSHATDKQKYSFLLTDDIYSMVTTTTSTSTSTSDNVTFVIGETKELYVTMDHTSKVYLTEDSTDPNLKKYISTIEKSS